MTRSEIWQKKDKIEKTAYIIQRGSCLVIVEKDGELHPVDHYGEGDIVGGLGILTGEPRRAHVEAETDMDLWVLTKAHFDEFTEKDSALLVQPVRKISPTRGLLSIWHRNKSKAPLWIHGPIFTHWVLPSMKW